MAGTHPDWLAHHASAEVERSSPSLGEMLELYRSTNGITQGELAARLLIDQTYVSKIERGVRVIRDVDFLARVSELLDVPLSELYPANGHPAQVGTSHDPVAARDLLALAQSQGIVTIWPVKGGYATSGAGFTL